MEARGPQAAAPGLAAPGGRRSGDLLEVVREELAAEYQERLYSYGRRSCEHIDALVLSALRQLPPHIRAMPAREAFRLGAFPAGGAAGGGGCAQGGAAGAVPLPAPPVPLAAAPRAGEAAAAPPLPQPTAPHGVSPAHPEHPLARVRPQYADGRWACDRCGAQCMGASWHCSLCSFDLCEGCWARSVEAEGPRSPPEKKRQDIQMQANQSLAKLKRLKPQEANVSGGLAGSGSIGSLVLSGSGLLGSAKALPGAGGAAPPLDLDPAVVTRMEELENKTQELEEFKQILGESQRRLEMLPAGQRRSFMSRAADTYERLFVRGRADAGGA